MCRLDDIFVSANLDVIYVVFWEFFLDVIYGLHYH